MCWYTYNGEEKFLNMSPARVVDHFRREGFRVLTTTGGPWPTTLMQKQVLKGISLVHVGEVTR